MIQKRIRLFSQLLFLALVSTSTVVSAQTGSEAKSQSMGISRGGDVITGLKRTIGYSEVKLPISDDGQDAPTNMNFSQLTPGPQPEAVDSTTLFVNKDATGTTLYLTWNGDDSPFNIFRCYEPSFQNGVMTMAAEAYSTDLTVSADTTKTLECFEIAGASVVSVATQGTGYDPTPSPTVPSASNNGLWWGQDITLTADYLDPIAKGNITFMTDLPVRAGSVTASGTYATDATFTIPDDARGFYPVIEAHDRSSDPNGSYSFVFLYAPGVGPYTNINGVTYAAVGDKGNIWVAASGTVQEIDLFKEIPDPKDPYTGASNPYISRMTAGGKILFVDGYSGVTTIYQIDASSNDEPPQPTIYASTKDDSFTRNILPRGIAVDPDGTACYIADANSNKVVKIPAGAGTGSSTIKDNWGNKTFSYGFPNPCGMDINVGHQVFVAANDGYIYQISGQYSWSYDSYPGSYVHSLEIDRNYSISSFTNYNWSNELGMAEAFNRNEVGTTGVKSYHGGMVFATSDGHIDLEPDWSFRTYRRYPQKVILNNSGQAIGYPSSYQTTDRIIELKVLGWANLPLKLTVIDPPDLSPYAPDNGCLQGGCAPSLPYKANDNIGNTDYGICAEPDCSDGAAVSKVLTCSSDYTLIYYLKVPARYSGNNFQVEVQKTDYYGNDLPETRAAMCSSVYTSWKRVFVERDKMFRRGGLLYSSYGATGKCGGSGQPACCGTGSELPCNQIKVYDWTNVANGDTIVIFDETNTAEAGGEVRTITDDPYDNGDGTKTITLSAALTKNYFTGRNETTEDLDFSNGHSGGMGVLSGCDPVSNQINGSNSCYYEADMRAIENTYNDAYVEFYGLRNGMGVVPYLPYGTADIWDFGWLWFSQKNNTSYIHSLGAETNPLAYGETLRMDSNYSPARPVRCSILYEQHIEDDVLPSSGACFEGTTAKAVSQAVDIHEKAHQFRVNPLSTPEHCISDAWTGAGVCIMNQAMCPGVTPTKLDADVESGTTTNPGDVYDVRICEEDLPNE